MKKTECEKMLLGLPIEFCEFCGCERIFSEDRSFCLTCGIMKKKEEECLSRTLMKECGCYVKREAKPKKIDVVEEMDKIDRREEAKA